MKCGLDHRWTMEMNSYKCENGHMILLLTSTGEDALQSDGHHWWVSGAGQWSRRGLQTETSHTLASVHWTGLPGDLLDMYGKSLHWSRRDGSDRHTLLKILF